MARTRVKCIFILYCLIVSVSARSLPQVHISTSITEDAYTVYSPERHVAVDSVDNDALDEVKVQDINYVINGTARNEGAGIIFSNNIRPGQGVRYYTVELTRNGDNINGRLSMEIRLTTDTINDPIRLHALELQIDRVQAGMTTEAHVQDAQFDPAENLEIMPAQGPAVTYFLIIEYSMPLRTDGSGVYLGHISEQEEYIAMNLHPTNARRVFPSMDEPNVISTTSFTFNGLQFDTLLSNSLLAVDSTTTFRSLQGPVHQWAMVAHSMSVINMPVANLVFLYVRQGVLQQDAQASVAINNYYNAFNEWTGKPHNEIIQNQNGGLHIMAVPDVSRDWYGLSTLCIWEPYILMENNNAVKQRKTALVTIAEGIARQWFGYFVFPQNWRYQWVIAGLGKYAAYEIVKEFQTPPPGQEDETLIDMDTIFTTDTIQESLLYDAYNGMQPLELQEDIFDDNVIRLHIAGVRTKAPALLRMTNLVLSDQRNIVQAAVRAVLSIQALEAVNTRSLIEALHSEYMFGGGGSGLIEQVEEFLNPWLNSNGYPLIHIGLRPGGVVITQERFGFTVRDPQNFLVPLSFTTSVNPNFDNVNPTMVMAATTTLNFALGPDDWVLFNIQGQGYYRVNYDADLWQRIIEALSDPETREDIHPLNRATLVDDSLNMARAGKIGYDVAFEIALTMELETEYAVWKAFVRNMDFIRKRLVAFVAIEEDLDEDIYLRMVRRTIEAVEEEIGFEPEGAVEPSMVSLTRGLVMDHACRAGYDPCIAAAVDWFYDPNNEEEVNPNIPPEIRPAVYCTMVREDEDGEDEVIDALQRRLEIEPSRYERLVILESLACSADARFISGLLEQTVAPNSPYVLEERSKIFEAVAGSSFENAGIALNFLIGRTRDIRDMYGGPEKLDEIIFIVAENILNPGQSNDFLRWVNSLNSNLGDSNLAAERAAMRIEENLLWLNERMEEAYEWIDENDASTVFASTFLLCLTLFIGLFNQHY